MLVAGGSTDVTTYFALRLTADGKAATGLTITNIDLQYVRSGVAPVAKVDATALAATDSVHADNKAIEIDSTDQPGLYRVDWPDAAFAAGVREVILTVKVATAFTEHLRVEIDGEVNVVEWAGTDVVAGAIPAAAADAAGGLPISGAGGLDLDTKLANTNEVTAARMAALTDWINDGRLDLLLDAIPTTAMRGTDNAATAADLLDKLGAVNEAAAAGDPSATESVMQYVKQIVNILVGTAGIAAFPAEAAPANLVSLAEVIRAIHADVTGLAGSVMRGTDGASTHGDPDPSGFIDAAISSRAATGAAMALTAAAINLIWDELTAEARTAGSYGQLFKDNVDAKISLAALAAVCTEVRLSELDAANLPADIAALNDISAADVLTQVNAALDTAIPELAQGVPAITPTMRTAVMLVYMALRNQLDIIAAFLKIHNDAGTVITKKALSDDGTTYSEAKAVTGP